MFLKQQLKKKRLSTIVYEHGKKGFVSMDRTNLFDLDDQRYHIVCMPKYKKPIEGLNEIFKIRIEGISFQKPENGIKLFDYCK